MYAQKGRWVTTAGLVLCLLWGCECGGGCAGEQYCEGLFGACRIEMPESESVESSPMSCCWLTNILVTGPWMLWGWCSLQPKPPTFTVTVGQVGPVRAMPRHLTKLTGSSSHLGLRPWPAGQLLSCRNWIWPRVKTFGDGSSTVQRWITRKFFGLPGNSLKIACLDAYFKHYSICYRWTHAVRGWRHDCSRWYAWHPIWIQWQAEAGKIPSAKNSQESFGVETKRRTDTFSVQLLTDLHLTLCSETPQNLHG